MRRKSQEDFDKKLTQLEEMISIITWIVARGKWRMPVLWMEIE